MKVDTKVVLLIIAASVSFGIWSYSAFNPNTHIDPDYLSWVKSIAMLLIGALVNHQAVPTLPKEQ